MGYWTINFKLKAHDKDGYKKIKNYLQTNILKASKDPAESCWSNWDDLEYNDKDCIISDDTELHLPNDLINIARSLKEAFNEEELGSTEDSSRKVIQNKLGFTIEGSREYSAGGELKDFVIELKNGNLTLCETDWYEPYFGDIDGLKDLIDRLIEEYDLPDEYYDELEDIEDFDELQTFCEANSIFTGFKVDTDILFSQDCEIAFNNYDKKIYVNETPEYRAPMIIDDDYEWE